MSSIPRLPCLRRTQREGGIVAGPAGIPQVEIAARCSSINCPLDLKDNPEFTMYTIDTSRPVAPQIQTGVDSVDGVVASRCNRA